MENKKIEAEKMNDGTVLITETKTFEQTKDDLRIRLNNIDFEQQNIIKNNQYLKMQYENLENEKNKIREILKDLEKTTFENIGEVKNDTK